MDLLLGYPAALLIGVSLGMIGAGGAILTIPVLVFLFHIPAEIATTYSLFVVGFSAFTGSIGYMKNRLVSYETALTFGMASIISVFLTRKFIFPAIPHEFSVFGYHMLKDKFILILFSVVMILAAYPMIKKQSAIVRDRYQQVRQYGWILLAVNGALVGLLAGMLGAGGGFLIIPALVLIERLPMKIAIGTSLVIIAVNSFIGFTGDLFTEVQIDWILLVSVCALALGGILIGLTLSKKVSALKLRPAFGWFILVMAVYIIAKTY